MEKQYTLNEVAVMSGLTTRTLRNYMKMGILKGKMLEGIWKFGEEEIGDTHISVQPERDVACAK